MQRLDSILAALLPGTSNADNSSTRSFTQTPQSPPNVNPVSNPVAKLAFPRLAERSESWRKAVFALEPTHPKVAKLALALEGYLRRALHNDRSRGTQLLIAGDTGTGKTHGCRRLVGQFQAWAVDAMCEGHWRGSRIPSVEFREWSTVCDHENFDGLLHDLKSASLVVLDEIGAEVDRFKSGECNEKLRKTLNALEKHWVLATTNLNQKAREQRYDVRVASRLSAFAELDLFDAPDYRPKLAAGKEAL